MPRGKSLEEDLEELREERRRKEERGETLPREIDPHFKWRFGHDPNDEDAHPESGWEYATIDPASPPAAGPVILPHGGPDAGMVCQIKGCPHPLRIVDEFHPGEILSYVQDGRKVTFKNPIGVCILMCPNGHQVQMRADMLPNRGSPLWLP